jgi:hypothetical protein
MNKPSPVNPVEGWIIQQNGKWIVVKVKIKKSKRKESNAVFSS